MAETSRGRSTPEGQSGAGGLDSRLLTLVAATVHRQINTALGTEELSVEQWSVLDHLDRGGPCTMSALAAATGINGATLTRIADRLVSRALIYRSADSGDRRRVLVHLSERGKTTTQRVRPLILDAEDRVAEPLSPTERGELTHLLQRISTLGATTG